MSNYKQKPKSIVDVGEVGNASTGDIIYDGGVKLNDNFDAVYNAFGDGRLYDIGLGEGKQTIHATGYYQKFPTSYYGKGAVEPGSMHDLNTTGGTFIVTLPSPKLGELCEFINSNGSWSINPINFQAKSGTGSIAGSDRIVVNNGYSKVSFICVDDTPSKSVWRYSINPLVGDYSVPINTTYEIDNTKSWPIRLFKADMYEGVKILVSGTEIVVGEKERTVSEILLMVDKEANTNKGIVYSDEYSVLFNRAEKTYTIDFSVENGYVYANVNTRLSKVNFSIKTIETINTRVV